jgi:hypothetical protein
MPVNDVQAVHMQTAVHNFIETYHIYFVHV